MRAFSDAGHFRPHEKDGGHTIQSAVVDNGQPHAARNFTALCFTEPELLPIEVFNFNFSNRVINIWNSLPDHIVASPSVASFKRKLSKFHFNEQPLFLYLFYFFLLGHLLVQLFAAFVSWWHITFLLLSLVFVFLCHK